MVPWYVKFYLHTLKVSGDGRAGDIAWLGSIERGRPSVLEMGLSVDVGKTSISIDFDKAFIRYSTDFLCFRYTEHTPDANRGFDIGAAIVSDDEGGAWYSTNLLVNMPTPDFSMPYNVITLSCTVIAMLFGSVFNLAVREYECISK